MTKHITFLFLIVSAACIAGDMGADKIYKKVNKSVVLIYTEGQDGIHRGQGSGVMLTKDGTIVTNFHVIDDASVIKVMINGAAVPAKINGIDPAHDLALLSISCKSCIPISRTKKPTEVGAKVYAIGSPLGYENTISEGILSGRRHTSDSTAEILQITAPLSPGSSGGAIVNAKGELIGISAIASNGSAQNINFAISAELIDRIVLRENISSRELLIESGLRKAASLDFRTDAFSIIRILNNILDIDPANEKALENLCYTYFWLNETDKAETYCKKLFAVNRENLRYIFVNGSLLFKKGKYEEASKEARKLITKNSEAGSGHCMLGRCLYMMNKTDSAGVEIKKAIAQDSTDHDALFFLACIESEKKNLIDALSFAYRALEYDNRYFECSLLIGRLYSMKHNEETAREFYDDAMSFNPKSALPHLFKAQSYIVSRQYEQAADELKRIEIAANYNCNTYETMLVNALLSDNGRETKSAFSALYNCDPAKTFFFTAFVDSNGIKNNNYNEDFLIKNNGISGMDHSLICRINEEEWRLKKDVANNDYSYPGRVGDLLRKTRSGNIKTSIKDTIRLGNNYYINCSGLLRYKQQKLISINNWGNEKYPELTAIIFDSRGQKICSILNGIIISGSDRIETRLLTSEFIVYEKNSNRPIITLKRNPKSSSKMIDVSLDYYLPDGYRLLMTPVKSDKRINVFGEDNYFSGGGCLEIR